MGDNIEQLFKYIFGNLYDSLSTPANLPHKLFLSILILFLWIWIYRLSKSLLKKFASNVKIYTILQKTIRNVLSILAVLLLSGIWINIKNSAMLALLILVFLTAFTIKNLSTNLVAWLMLLRKKYFKLYDRIEINDVQGDIIKITPFYFKMMERGNNLSSSTATGRVIHMPNHVLLNNTLYNYNQFISVNWKEIKYKITVDSDWKKTLDIVEAEGNRYINDFLRQYSDKKLHKLKEKAALFDEELKWKSYVLMEEDTIAIIAQFPVHYAKGTSAQSSLNQKIISRLHEASNIELHGETMHVTMDNVD